MLATAEARTGTKRPWLAPVLVGAGTLAATAYVAAVDPNRPGHYPTCPFRALTGLACPGCGGTRAVHALTHLDLGAAVGFNVLAVLALPLVVLMWARWLARTLGYDAPPKALPRATWALFAVVMVFTVARNLPFGAALAP